MTRSALELSAVDPTPIFENFRGSYGNEWTLDYGERGRTAVRRLLEEAAKAKIIPSSVNVQFVE